MQLQNAVGTMCRSVRSGFVSRRCMFRSRVTLRYVAVRIVGQNVVCQLHFHKLSLLFARFVDWPIEVSTTYMALWFRHLVNTVFESEQ